MDEGIKYADREPVVPNSSGTLEAPKKLYSTPSAARSVYRRLERHSIDRALINAAVDGLIAGNPPYEDDELEAEGLGHISNFNDLSALCTYERSLLAYSNAIYQTKTFVNLKMLLNAEPGQKPVTQQGQISDLLAYEFDYIFRKWPSFMNNVHILLSQIVKYGLSFVIWTDEDKFTWDVVDIDNFIIASDAPSNTDEITYFFIRNTYTLQYLYSVYKEALKNKDNDNFPWDADELERVILQYANSTVKNQSTDYTAMAILEDAFTTDSDLSAGFMSDSITLISLFQQEYDGKWSHYMFDPDIDEGDFLFQLPSQYDKLSDFFVPFIATPGEAKMFKSRGVGHKIFSSSFAQLQINNSIVDMAKLSSTPLLKGSATNDNEHTKITPGVLNYIGTADMVQTQFGQNIDKLVGASTYLTNRMEYNISNSGDNPAEPDKSAGSLAPAEGVRLSHKEHALTKNHMSQFYQAWDVVVRNMVKRLLSCKEDSPEYVYKETFIDRSKARGIPEIVLKVITNFSESSVSKLTGLPKAMDVEASRVAGDGSTYSAVLSMQQYADLMGGDIGGPEQIEDFRRQAILATFGPEYLETYMRSEAEADEKKGGSSLAGVENAVIMLGKSPIMSPDNVHTAHIPVHIALGSEVIGRISQGQMDVVEGDKIFTVLVPHLNEHVQAAARNPFNEKVLRSMEQSIKEINKYAELNRKNAQKAITSEMKKRQKDAEETNAVMTDEERKDFQLRREEARKDYALNAKESRNTEADARRGQMMQRKIETDAANQRHKINLDAANDQAKTVKEMSIKELEAEHKRIKGDSPSPTNLE